MIANRVFSSRIIRGKHHHVAARASRLAHQRTFASITIAAAAEHGDHPAASLAHELAGHGDDIAQGVVGVGVVDDHGKILPAIDGLKTTGHKVQRGCALSDLVQSEAAGQGSGARSQQVVDIDASGEAGGNRYFSLRA